MNAKTVLALTMGSLMAATTLQATSFTVTVNDSFDNNDPSVGTALSGRTPQVVNVAAGVWQKYGQQPDGAIMANGGRSVARSGADNGYRIGYAAHTGLVSREEVRVTGTLRYPGHGWPNQFWRGAGVGFYGTNTTTSGLGYFTGLALGPASDTDSTLNLKLIANTSGGNDGFVRQTPYTGSLTNSSDYHTLTYVVNTASGTVSQIELDGGSYSFTNAIFTEAGTRNFGFYCEGPYGDDYGYFDSVQVAGATVPRNVAVSDSFTDLDPTVTTNLNGRTPQVANRTGDVWHRYGTQLDGITLADGSRLVARSGADNGYRICITNTGIVPRRTEMTVTARLRYPGAGWAGQLYRGAGAGFYAAGTPAAGIGYFTGLALGPASNTDPTLNLKLINNSSSSGNGGFVSQTPYTGTRTAAGDYHDLTYTVDVITGTIKSIDLDGQSYSFSTTAFSAASTEYFGYYCSGPTGSDYGYFDAVQLALYIPPSGTVICIQ